MKFFNFPLFKWLKNNQSWSKSDVLNENKNIHQKTDLNKKLSMLDADYNVLKLERRQRVVEFLEKENPELQKIVDVCLDPKYKYADPLQKAKSIPYLKVKWDYFRFKNVDFENIQKGLWWECASNAILMLHEIRKQWFNLDKCNIKFVVWRDNWWFASEWSTHIFATVSVWLVQIVLDPSFKEVSFLGESWYVVSDELDIISTINYDEEHVREIWDITLKWEERIMFSHIKVYLPLWFLEDWEYLLSYSVAKVADDNVRKSYFTIVLSVADILWNDNVFFLDKTWEIIHQNLSKITLKKEIIDVVMKILRDFEKNWTLKWS